MLNLKSKILFTFFCFAFYLAAAQSFQSQNVQLLSNWTDPAAVAEPVFGSKYNSVYGFSSNGKEYAFLGSAAGFYIIDVSDGNSPQLLDFVPGRKNNVVNRELKVYDHYAYIISDASQPNSFQIIDLAYLPDSVHLIHDSTNIIQKAHTLFIEDTLLYVGSVYTGSIHRLGVFSLSDPTNPIALRYLDEDYPGDNVHDIYVSKDTVYASCGSEGLKIYKFNGVVFQELQTISTYPDAGANHSSCLSSDHKTLFFTDEIPGLSIKSADISDFNNITIIDTFSSDPRACAHNPYIKGDHLLVSYYQDGLQIFDVTDPSFVVRTGYFDTDTLNGSNNNYPAPAYHGCWGAYAELPSGNVLVSDMQNGLFVLRVNYKRAAYVSGTVSDSVCGRGIHNAQILINGETLAVTDLTGAFRFGIPASGNQAIDIIHPDYPTKAEQLQLTPGQTTSSQILLNSSSSLNFSFGFYDEDHNPLKDIKAVTISGSDTNYYTSNSSGVFSDCQIVQGTILLNSGKWGYTQICDSVIDIRQEPQLELTMKKGYEDNFDLDLGWQMSSTSTTGNWVRAIPKGNPASDVNLDCGNYSYVTGNNSPIEDVDGGHTLLTSPYMDLSLFSDPLISYKRWYFGNSNTGDTLIVRVSTPRQEVELERVLSTENTWKEKVFRVKDHIQLQDSVKIRFYVVDGGADSKVEAAIDSFNIAGALVAMEELEDGSDILFPNPSTGKFTIINNNREVENIEVYDLTGHSILFKKSITEKETVFEIVEAGLYIVCVYFENQTSRKYKVVVSH